MTDIGAITLAIEALRMSEPEHLDKNDDAALYSATIKHAEAFQALKAFKDGVPDGLRDNVERIIIRNQYIETNNDKDGKMDIMVFYKAAKHLQEGIK